MDRSQLRRDPQAVRQAMKELPGGVLVTTQPCKIYIPQRYEEYGLAKLGIENHILGIFALVLEDGSYTVCLVNAMVPIDPVQTNKVKFDGDDYLEFVFQKGSTIMKSMDLVKTDTLTYLLFDEFFQKGNIPWYVGYEELGKLFDTAVKHAGAKIGQQREVTELIASIVARNPKDRTQNYRTLIKSEEDLVKTPPVFVPLMSIRYAATNTMTKIGGSYFSKGVNSALLSPAERPERIETILRK